VTSRTVIVARSQYCPTNEIWAMSQGAKSQYRLHCDGRKRVESNVDSRGEIVAYRLNHPDTFVHVKHLRTNADKNVSGRIEETVSQSKSGNTKLLCDDANKVYFSDRVI